jgi:hypothetical protein
MQRFESDCARSLEIWQKRSKYVRVPLRAQMTCKNQTGDSTESSVARKTDVSLEASPFRSSIERGCQENRPLPAPFERPWLHETNELASPRESAASQSDQINKPSKNEVGLDVSHNTRIGPFVVMAKNPPFRGRLARSRGLHSLAVSRL